MEGMVTLGMRMLPCDKDGTGTKVQCGSEELVDC